MTKNIDAVLSRGERIELLVDKTDQMSAQARAFRKRTVVLRRKMWWKNVKVLIAIGVSVVVSSEREASSRHDDANPTCVLAAFVVLARGIRVWTRSSMQFMKCRAGVPSIRFFVLSSILNCTAQRCKVFLCMVSIISRQCVCDLCRPNLQEYKSKRRRACASFM